MAAVSTMTPENVGKAFVHHYYQLLGLWPDKVYKFYKDDSQVGRPGEDDDIMSITTTVQGIKEKLASLKPGDFTATIKSVATQASFNSGVLVLVTGKMTGRKDNKTRNFTQNFFIAPQQGGYYVLNDIFSYIENENEEPHKVQVKSNTEAEDILKRSYVSVAGEELDLIEDYVVVESD